MKKIEVRTFHRNEMVDITQQVRDVIREIGTQEGVAHLWSFHTTAGLTVNEGADPDVARDITWKLCELVPEQEKHYRHGEGNSDSHVKTTLVGPSIAIIVSQTEPVLGTWQAVFLCEFDGPRRRTVGIQVIPTSDP